MNKQQTIRAILDAAAEGNLSKAEDALDEWASIQCAEKDRYIAELTEAFETNKIQLMELATIATDKEESIKELVEGLEWIEEKTRLDCYTEVDVAEINERAEQLIQKHKQ